MIVSSYSFIDASTGDYQEEEVFYQEEGEENFVHHLNQGKVILLQSEKLTMCKALPHLPYAYDPISQFYFTS